MNSFNNNNCITQQILSTVSSPYLEQNKKGEVPEQLIEEVLEPVIEKVKIKYPSHKIIVTFFSPSGYEVRKNNTIADVTVYLPLDTKSNAKRFIELTHPEMVFFIKYEFWPNYLNELKQRGIKTYLISGIFRENQMFFKWYGSFYRSALKTFDYFFISECIYF